MGWIISRKSPQSFTGPRRNACLSSPLLASRSLDEQKRGGKGLGGWEDGRGGGVAGGKGRLNLSLMHASHTAKPEDGSVQCWLDQALLQAGGEDGLP